MRGGPIRQFLGGGGGGKKFLRAFWGPQSSLPAGNGRKDGWTELQLAPVAIK